MFKTASGTTSISLYSFGHFYNASSVINKNTENGQLYAKFFFYNKAKLASERVIVLRDGSRQLRASVL